MKQTTIAGGLLSILLVGVAWAADVLQTDIPELGGVAGVRGDTIYYGPSGWRRLEKGQAGYVLTMGSQDPKWAAGGGGGGGSVFVDTVEIVDPDFTSNAFYAFTDSASTITLTPSAPVTASGTSATPNAATSTEFIYTMTGNFSLNAISNCTTNHARDGIEFTLIQGGSGGYQPSFATNYLFNDVIPGITLVWTNVGYRAVFRVKPRRDNVAVYDVVQFVDGMVP